MLRRYTYWLVMPLLCAGEQRKKWNLAYLHLNSLGMKIHVHN